jgi:hypothetical protein
LFDVVDDEEQVAGTEEGDQALVNRLAWRSRDTELPGSGDADHGRIGQRFERDERGAVGELAGGGVGRGQGKGGLADATRPGQRHQAHISLQQHRRDRSQLLRPVHQGAAHGRQWRGGMRRGRAGETFRQEQRQVIGDQGTQLVGILEAAIGDHALGLDHLQEAGQPRLPPRCLLRIDQPRLARRQPVLVLQAGNVHTGGDPPVGRGVDSDENVALLQVGAIQVARRVGARTEFEQHGRQP